MTTVLQRADLSFAETLAPSGLGGAVQSEESGAFAAIMAVSLPSNEAAISAPAPAVEVRSLTGASLTPDAVGADGELAPVAESASEPEVSPADPTASEAAARSALGLAPASPDIVEDAQQGGHSDPAPQDETARAAAALMAGRTGAPVRRQMARAGQEQAEPAPQASPSPVPAAEGDQADPVDLPAPGFGLSGTAPAKARQGGEAAERSGVALPSPKVPISDKPAALPDAPAALDGNGAKVAVPVPPALVAGTTREAPEEQIGAASPAPAPAPAGSGEERAPAPAAVRPLDSIAQDAMVAPMAVAAARARGVGEGKRIHDRSPLPAEGATTAAATTAAEGAPVTPHAESGVGSIDPMVSKPRQMQDMGQRAQLAEHHPVAEAMTPRGAELPDEMAIAGVKPLESAQVLPPERLAAVADGAVVASARNSELRTPDPASTLSHASPARPVLDTRRADWADRVGAEIEAAHRDGKLDIELSLRPKNLGELRIRIEISGSDTTIQIATETQSAARLISSHEERLAQILDSSGLRLSAIAASVGGGAHPGGGRGHEKGQRNQTTAAAAVGKANRASAGSTGIPSNQRELAERVSMINLIA